MWGNAIRTRRRWVGAVRSRSIPVVPLVHGNGESRPIPVRAGDVVPNSGIAGYPRKRRTQRSKPASQRRRINQRNRGDSESKTPSPDHDARPATRSLRSRTRRTVTAPDADDRSKPKQFPNIHTTTRPASPLKKRARPRRHSEPSPDRERPARSDEPVSDHPDQHAHRTIPIKTRSDFDRSLGSTQDANPRETNRELQPVNRHQPDQDQHQPIKNSPQLQNPPARAHRARSKPIAKLQAVTTRSSQPVPPTNPIRKSPAGARSTATKFHRKPIRKFPGPGRSTRCSSRARPTDPEIPGQRPINAERNSSKNRSRNPPAQPDQPKPVSAENQLADSRRPSTRTTINNTTSLPDPIILTDAPARAPKPHAPRTPASTPNRDPDQGPPRSPPPAPSDGQDPLLSPTTTSPLKPTRGRPQSRPPQPRNAAIRTSPARARHTPRSRRADPATSDQLVQKRDAIAERRPQPRPPANARPVDPTPQCRRPDSPPSTPTPPTPDHRPEPKSTRMSDLPTPTFATRRSTTIDGAGRQGARHTGESNASRRPSRTTRHRGTTKPGTSSPAEMESTIQHPREQGSVNRAHSLFSPHQPTAERDHRLGQNIARALRPPRRNRTLPLRSTPTSQSQAPRQVRARAVPLGPQVDDVVDQRGQPAAHRLAQARATSRHRSSAQTRSSAERERSRDAQASAEHRAAPTTRGARRTKPPPSRRPRRHPPHQPDSDATRSPPTSQSQAHAGVPANASTRNVRRKNRRVIRSEIQVKVTADRSRTHHHRRATPKGRACARTATTKSSASSANRRRKQWPDCASAIVRTCSIAEIGIPVQQHPNSTPSQHARLGDGFGGPQARQNPARQSRQPADPAPQVHPTSNSDPDGSRAHQARNRPMRTLHDEAHPEKFTPRESRNCLAQSGVLIERSHAEMKDDHPDLPVTSHQYPPRSISRKLEVRRSDVDAEINETTGKSPGKSRQQHVINTPQPED